MQAPPLATVLAGHTSSSSPYNLSAFKDFLAANYCSEVLGFITDVMSYRHAYEVKIFLVDPTSQDIKEVCEQWEELMDTYIVSNATQEINLPSAARNQLLSYAHPVEAPSPDLLQISYNLMLELLAGVYMQFSESVKRQANLLDSKYWFVYHFKQITFILTLTQKLSQQIVSSPLEPHHGKVAALEADEAPFYRRAHGLWGSKRIHRSIKIYRGNGKKSESPERRDSRG